MTPASRPARRRRHTKQSVAKAHERAKDLGQLVPVEAAGKGPDGEPVLGEGQVYATRTGESFHSTWCGIVDGVWYDTAHPGRLFVIEESTVGQRRQCKECSGGL